MAKPRPVSVFSSRNTVRTTSLLTLRRDARSFVGDRHSGPPPFRVVAGRDPQTSLVIHRMNTIVAQVDAHSFHLLSVEIQRGKVRIQIENEFYITVGRLIESHDLFDDLLRTGPIDICGAGMRANFENSSSICLRLPTSLTMTCVDSSQIRSSPAPCPGTSSSAAGQTTEWASADS